MNKLFLAFLAISLTLLTGFSCHRRSKNRLFKTESVKSKTVEKIKAKCEDGGKCTGKYAIDDGGTWYFYTYQFQGTDTTSASSIPSKGWTKGEKPEEEEIEETQEAEVSVDVETDAGTDTDSGTDSGDSGSSDSGGSDSGGGDGGGGGD